MNSTNGRAAAIFFADLLLPLRHANLRHGTAYLDRGQRRQSYWSDVASRTGGIERLSSAACDGEALLGSISSYWARRNEQSLLRLVPHLAALRVDLVSAAPMEEHAAERLTEFIYPIF